MALLRQSVNKTIFPSTAETIGATSTYKTLTDDMGNYSTITVQINVTAVSGSDTIALQIQDSPDGTNFDDISGASLAGAATTGIRTIRVSAYSKYIRAKVTGASVDSTATFTYSIVATFKS